MSKLSSDLTNAMPRLLLASPAHRLVSSRWATLHFTGRRSGRRFHLPIAYITDNDQSVSDGSDRTEASERIVISTDSGWWHNLVDGQPFEVNLRGRRRPARAERIEGDAAIDALRRLVVLPGYTKAAGIARRDGRVGEAELKRVASERVVLAINVGDRA